MEVDEVDAFDFADPVDITAKLPSNFKELIESKKWQERREALDALLEQAKTEKIMDKDYTDLIALLAKVSSTLCVDDTEKTYTTQTLAHQRFQYITGGSNSNMCRENSHWTTNRFRQIQAHDCTSDD